MSRSAWPVAAVALLLVPAVAAAPEVPLDLARADVANGAALYARHCALCHGASGEGMAADHAPALANPDYLALASDTYLAGSILWGRPGTPMSAWGVDKGGPLDAAALRDLVGFLRTWGDGRSVVPGALQARGNPARGMGVYATHCAECHGLDGRSDTAPDLTNPVFLHLAGTPWVAHVVRHGRAGTAMPAFGERLTEPEIADVVYWLYSQAKPPDLTPVSLPPVDYAAAVVNPGGREPRFTLREGRYVGVDAVKRALDRGERMVFADARATSDWLVSHLPGAVPLPFYEAEAAAEKLPRDTWIIAYCACPHAASGRLIDALAARGFTRLAVLDEGITEWERRGYPVVVGTGR